MKTPLVAPLVLLSFTVTPPPPFEEQAAERPQTLQSTTSVIGPVPASSITPNPPIADSPLVVDVSGLDAGEGSYCTVSVDGESFAGGCATVNAERGVMQAVVTLSAGTHVVAVETWRPDPEWWWPAARRDPTPAHRRARKRDHARVDHHGRTDGGGRERGPITDDADAGHFGSKVF